MSAVISFKAFWTFIFSKTAAPESLVQRSFALETKSVPLSPPSPTADLTLPATSTLNPAAIKNATSVILRDWIANNNKFSTSTPVDEILVAR